MIAKAGFDPAEGDDPLLERSAHTFPISLLPPAEPDPEDSKAGTELLSEETTEEGIKKRGRGNFTNDTGGRFDLPALATGEEGQKWNLLPGIDPNARIAVRYAVDSDGALRRDAKQSEWYQRHGKSAGKERSTTNRNYGREREDGGSVSWSGRGQGEGRDFAKRIGRERRGPYDRPQRRDDRRGGRRTTDDLDKELENIARRRQGGEEEGGMDVDMDVNMEQSSRPKRRERRGKDDLDKGQPYLLF